MRDRAQHDHAQRAEQMGEQDERAADLGDGAADVIEAEQNRIGRGVALRGRGERLTCRTSSIRPRSRSDEIDDARRRAARRECAVEPLDQPGAEGVEPLESGEIDVDAARACVAAGGVVDDLLKLGGALGGPRAGCGRAPAVRRRWCAVEQALKLRSRALAGGS